MTCLFSPVVLNAPVILSIGIFPKKYARVNNFLVPLTTQEFTSGIQFAWYAKSEGAVHIYITAELLYKE